jgi:hypothetical protein
MAFFARKCGSGNWDSITKETPEDLAFPADVLADLLGAANEVSVWEVDDADGPEVEILAAALQRPNVGSLSDVTFRFISKWRLDQLGLRMRQTTGDTVDNAVKGKHWLIETKTVEDAIKLAKAFIDRPERSFSQTDVMRRFARSVQEKRISTKRITPELWSKLIEGRYLQVITDQQSEAGANERP